MTYNWIPWLLLTVSIFCAGCRKESAPLFQSDPASPQTSTIEDGKVLTAEFKDNSPRAETPFECLEQEEPARALELMRREPQWIGHRRNDDQQTPLHVAASRGYTEVVKWLLENGADVNAKAFNEFTPLHMADDPAVIDLLLVYDPDLSLRSVFGKTPLHDSVVKLANAKGVDERSKWQRIVRLYLDAGADYDAFVAVHLDDLDRLKTILQDSPRNKSQATKLLRIASSLGRLSMCRYLIESYQADVDDFDRGAGSPIIKEALRHTEIVRLLIEKGADLETRITWRGGRTGVWIIGDNATLLHFAARDGNPETVKLLIDNGVDIHATAEPTANFDSEHTALEIASLFGNANNAIAILNHPTFDLADKQLRQSVLDKCVSLGAPPGWFDEFAEGVDRPALIQALLAKGANPNQNGITAVQIAAEQISPNSEQWNQQIKSIIALLIEAGATLDMFSAVAIGDLNQVDRLLRQNPEMASARGRDGYPALHFATDMNDKKVVERLLAAGCPVDIRNNSERKGHLAGTALHRSAFWGRCEIGKLLIDAGAEVDAFTKRKTTPLHCAARQGNVKFARFLLENGARADAQDEDGKTPLDWCRELNEANAPEIEKLLRKYVSNTAP